MRLPDRPRGVVIEVASDFEESVVESDGLNRTDNVSSVALEDYFERGILNGESHSKFAKYRMDERK